MENFLHVFFGAPAQVIVGIFLVIVTTIETYWWMFIDSPPSTTAVFIVSMEALYFAAYAIIGGALAVMWLDKRTPNA